jgi:uncharacterized delta-60 repeat protein
LVSFLVGLQFALPVVAQQPGSLDTNYVAVAGTDVAPNILAPLADGRLYVGGSFTNYGGAGRAQMARLLPTGQVDTSFTLPPLRVINAAVIFNGQVLVPASTNVGNVGAILPLPDGRAVIAGKFNHLGATPARGLALLNLDGSPAVTAFDFETIEPEALLAGPGGTFYAGGKGNLVSQRLPLLRFRPDGSRDPSFTPPLLTELGYASANPFILRAGPDDTLYSITAAAVGFTPTSDIVRLTSSGALDSTFAGTGKAGIPFANFSSFVTDAAGRMTFTGVTSYRGATLTRKINRLTRDGSLDATYQVALDPGFGARVVAVQADGKLLYTGGQLPINRLKADGTVDTAYADPGKVPVPQNFLSLSQFALAQDGSLFAGGFTFSKSFALINGVYHIFGDPNSAPVLAVQPVAQTNTLGARTRFSVTAQGASPLTYQWFRNGVAIGGATESNLILEPTTAADAAADFHCVVANSLGAAPSETARLTLLEPVAGNVYRETDPPTGANSQILDLQFDATGGLIAAGGFTQFNGTNRIRIARLIDHGRHVDPAYDTATLNDLSLVQHVLPLRSGKVLALGNFGVTYNGVQHNDAVRLHLNGALDTTFNPTGRGGLSGSRFSEGPGGELLVATGRWNDELLPFAFGRLSAEGVREASFVPSPAFFPGGLVLALPDGKVLVGGRTNSAGSSSGVLRLNADGSQDGSFYRGLQPDFTALTPTALLRQPDGKILVAGTFNRLVGFQNYTLGVIRLLEHGQLDPSFNPVPALSSLVGFPVQRIALQADGRILIQGAFTSVGGFPRPGVARLWSNGVVDIEFATGSPRRTYLSGNPLGTVSALAVSPTNEIFLGGDFHQFDGLPRTNFVRVLGGPLRAPPAPPTLASVPARVVAATGTNVTLTVVPAGEGPFQYQWRRNSQTGSSLFTDILGATNASLSLANLRVEDSGLFQVAVVNPGGAIFSAYLPLLVEPSPVVPGTIDRSWVAQGFLRGVSAVAPDGLVYGARAEGVTRHFEDGTPDLSFVTPADLVRADSLVDNSITALLRQPDGRLLLVGRLSTDGGPCNVIGNTCFEPKRGLVRLLPDGSYDPDFIQTNSFSGDAQLKPGALLLQTDGKILVGGAFQNFSGRTVTGLVRFGADGAFDDSFVVNLESDLTNPPRTLPGTASVLLPLPDGRFYVGGSFTKVQGVACSGIARLNANGSLDTGFVPPAMANVGLGQSGSLTLYGVGPVTPEGGLYVFGRFQWVAGGPIYAALRLRPDGSVDDTFKVTSDFAINTGAVQTDGKLIITGQFTQLNGQSRGGYARLDLDGSTDASFTLGTAFGVGVPLTLLPDGKLLAGGTRSFTGVAVEAVAAEVDFTLTPTGLELTWPAGYQLQRATTLAPADWQNVANPSPFTVPLSGVGEFFRVVPAP